MKNKKMLLGIIIAIMLMVSLVILTGCKNNEENSINNGNEEQNISEKSNKESKDDSSVKFLYITSNNANTVALDTEGNVWSMYNNKVPEKVDINAKITAIDAGEHYTVALDTEGNVWTWGKNSSGQLGNGTTVDNDIPQKVFENVSMISAGYSTVLAITKNNELYSWGYGAQHYLPKDNSNDTNNYLAPTKYESDIQFVYAEAGKLGGGTALDKDGNRYIWGTYISQLGVEPRQIGVESNVIPYVVKKVADDTIKFKKLITYSNETFAIDENDNLYVAGNKNAVIGIAHENEVVAKFTQIAEGTKFKEVCPRDKYAIALDTNGNIWAWGEKNDITTKESVEPFKLTSDRKYTAIAFNNFIDKTAYAIDEDGNLYVWGESKGTIPTIMKVNK